jgi:hypothetical protein
MFNRGFHSAPGATSVVGATDCVTLTIRPILEISIEQRWSHGRPSFIRNGHFSGGYPRCLDRRWSRRHVGQGDGDAVPCGWNPRFCRKFVSVAVKMDFFRNIFLRRRLHARDKRTDPVLDRLVNQNRFVFYFSDEFGSVALNSKSGRH